MIPYLSVVAAKEILLCTEQNPKNNSYNDPFCYTNYYKPMHSKMTNHGNEASYELEILEVVRVDVGGRVDLETVVIFTSIFKQAVHGV